MSEGVKQGDVRWDGVNELTCLKVRQKYETERRIASKHDLQSSRSLEFVGRELKITDGTEQETLCPRHQIRQSNHESDKLKPGSIRLVVWQYSGQWLFCWIWGRERIVQVIEKLEQKRWEFEGESYRK